MRDTKVKVGDYKISKGRDFVIVDMMAVRTNNDTVFIFRFQVQVLLSL